VQISGSFLMFSPDQLLPQQVRVDGTLLATPQYKDK
jgi:hypothetical protein